jgi:ribonuclease VapC
MKCVVDASAVLAFLFDEPGADAIRSNLPAASISTVNLCEVYQRAIERGADALTASEKIAALKIAPIDFSRDDALAAARLRAPTRHLGLSLGDRACLALAQRLKLPAFTADSAWTELDIGIDVRLIR